MFETITARELAERLDSGADDYVLIDTRPEESYKAWHVEGAKNVPFGPAETLDGDRRAAIEALADGRSVVTICGKGATSTVLAAELDANGFEDVSVVKGGMRDWNALYERARIGVGDEDLLIVQFQRRAKGCLSYLVGSRETGEAVVVDPTRHTDQYVTTAAEEGMEIVRVLDTHVHADHVSGGRGLADRLGVPYHLGGRATERDLAFEFEPLADGETIELGGLSIETVAAPGHTTEAVTYRVGDEAILTGDALFLDSVGRTELQFGEEGAERGARLEYETLHDRLAALPGGITVLPGHVTVTSDGRFEPGSPGDPVAASLGEIRERLDLFGLDEAAFVERMVENAPEKPDNYEAIIEINRGVGSADDREATTLETGANNCAA